MISERAEGVADQLVLYDRQGVGQVHPDVAQRLQAGQFLIKKTAQCMSCVLHEDGFLAPCALVALEQPFAADVLPFGRGAQEVGQGLGVLVAEVDAVSGQRMDAVRRVTDQRQARCDGLRDAHQAQREGGGRGDLRQLAEFLLAGGGDTVGERLRRERQQFVRVRIGRRPDDGDTVRAGGQASTPSSRNH